MLIAAIVGGQSPGIMSTLTDRNAPRAGRRFYSERRQDGSEMSDRSIPQANNYNCPYDDYSTSKQELLIDHISQFHPEAPAKEVADSLALKD